MLLAPLPTPLGVVREGGDRAEPGLLPCTAPLVGVVVELSEAEEDEGDGGSGTSAALGIRVAENCRDCDRGIFFGVVSLADRGDPAYSSRSEPWDSRC